MNRPANDEMVQGFMDGYDSDAPEPSDNRSHSYRHGFKAGRTDKASDRQGPFSGISCDELRRMAAEAMARDECAANLQQVSALKLYLRKRLGL